MHIYNTVVVEDEGPARRRLAQMVHKHSALELVSAIASGEEAIQTIPALQPDLLLLDIQLKDITAFEVLEKITDHIKAKIIFITAYDSYAVKAFEVDAIDYLLKPFDELRFEASIAKITKTDSLHINAQILSSIKQNLNRLNQRIAIPEGSKVHYFSKDEIIYIQSDKYYVFIYTTQERRLIRITLKKLHTILPENFVRINKSTIINVHNISQVVNQKKSARIVLFNGEEFHASLTYHKNLKNILPTN